MAQSLVLQNEADFMSKLFNMNRNENGRLFFNLNMPILFSLFIITQFEIAY